MAPPGFLYFWNVVFVGDSHLARKHYFWSQKKIVSIHDDPKPLISMSKYYTIILEGPIRPLF